MGLHSFKNILYLHILRLRLSRAGPGAPPRCCAYFEHARSAVSWFPFRWGSIAPMGLFVLALVALLARCHALSNSSSYASGYCLQTAGFGTVSSPEFVWPTGPWTISFFFRGALPQWDCYPVTFVANARAFAPPPGLCQLGMSAYGSVSQTASEDRLFSLYHFESPYFSWGADLVAFPNASFIDGAWHHILLTSDGGHSGDGSNASLALFLDGASAGVAWTESPAPTAPGRVTLAAPVGWELTSGLLENFRVFSAQATQADAAALASNTEPAAALAASVVIDYRFDDVDAFANDSRVTDSSGLGRHGIALVQVCHRAAVAFF